jgi:hypothetical protein
MKVSAFVFVRFLTFTPAAISTADADGNARCGTAFDIAQQYANGGKFGGVTSGATGTVLDVAWDSMSFLGSLDRIASAWRVPPVLAKGN